MPRVASPLPNTRKSLMGACMSVRRLSSGGYASPQSFQPIWPGILL